MKRGRIVDKSSESKKSSSGSLLGYKKPLKLPDSDTDQKEHILNQIDFSELNIEDSEDE